MTPTTCTGWRIDPATLKYTADPPRASAVSPNGVKIESRAMLPTTSKVMRSHPVGSGDAEHMKTVGENDSGRAGEQQPSTLGRFALRRSDGAGMVIPPMHRCRELVQTRGNPVWLALACSGCGYLGEFRQFLEELRVLRSRQRFELELPGDRVRIAISSAKDSAQTRVRHLDVEHRILLTLLPCQIHVEHQLRVALAHQEEIPDRVRPNIIDEVAHCHIAAGPLGDLDLLATPHDGHHLVQDKDRKSV